MCCTRCMSPILVARMWSRQSGFHVEGRDVDETCGGVAGERAELNRVL
jgi:hypothetical protein